MPHQAAHSPPHNLLNEELKSDEVRKIEKYAQILSFGGGIGGHQHPTNTPATTNNTSNTNNENQSFDWCVIETILYQVNQAEFFSVLQLLESQRHLTERHNALPLVRERIE